MSITDAQILALKPRLKPYKVSIGKGAYILVNPVGSKYWRLKYRLNSKEKNCSLGVFPEVSVEAAKVARDAARALIRQGLNPSIARREAKEAAAATQAVVRPVFRLALSKYGALTIETDKKALTLTSLQTQALTAFLTVNKQDEKEGQECASGT